MPRKGKKVRTRRRCAADSASSPLLDLPNECLLLVLSFLGPKGICSAAVVCKGLEEATRQPKVWERCFLSWLPEYQESFPGLHRAWFQNLRQAFRDAMLGNISHEVGAKQKSLQAHPYTGVPILRRSHAVCVSLTPDPCACKYCIKTDIPVSPVTCEYDCSGCLFCDCCSESDHESHPCPCKECVRLRTRDLSPNLRAAMAAVNHMRALKASAQGARGQYEVFRGYEDLSIVTTVWSPEWGEWVHDCPLCKQVLTWKREERNEEFARDGWGL